MCKQGDRGVKYPAMFAGEWGATWAVGRGWEKSGTASGYSIRWIERALSAA